MDWAPRKDAKGGGEGEGEMVTGSLVASVCPFTVFAEHLYFVEIISSVMR